MFLLPVWGTRFCRLRIRKANIAIHVIVNAASSIQPVYLPVEPTPIIKDGLAPFIESAKSVYVCRVDPAELCAVILS